MTLELFIETLPQQTVNGLTLGAVYALIALGYSMVYGVLRLLNFAHGDVYMIGAFIGYFTMTALIPDEVTTLLAILIITVSLLVATLICGGIGIVMEQFAYRPLRDAPRIASLITALGISFLLQHSVQLMVSANHRVIPSRQLISAGVGINIMDMQVSATRLIVMLVTLGLLIALYLLVQRSSIGRAMRAVATDREAAAMMGIRVNQVIVFAFFISSALAGAAGILSGLVFTRIWHTMGFIAGIKGFTASVMGGIGSLPGAVLGGFALGLLEAYATGFISPTYRDVIAFIILIAVLIVRPQGLLGKQPLRKV